MSIIESADKSNADQSNGGAADLYASEIADLGYVPSHTRVIADGGSGVPLRLSAVSANH